MDAAIGRWLHKQPDWASSSYHVQIKLWSSEVRDGTTYRCTSDGLGGDRLAASWAGPVCQARQPVGAAAPQAARLLDVIDAGLLHTHFQIILAPGADWSNAYSPTSLVPD